jgi:hypothetical protein
VAPSWPSAIVALGFLALVSFALWLASENDFEAPPLSAPREVKAPTTDAVTHAGSSRRTRWTTRSAMRTPVPLASTRGHHRADAT